MSIEKTDFDLGLSPPVLVEVSNPPKLYRRTKRICDLLGALVLLIPLIVFSVIFSVVNLFCNPGRLLYRQQRIGWRGEQFTIYKFRTMLGDDIHTRFACEEHERRNRFGDFLRKTRIDELPQVINVLLGDMSLIGPRPEQVSFYGDYAKHIQGYVNRQAVRPGISGLAQLKAGYTNSHVGTRRKLRWDMEYIARMGFGMDAYIFWHTLLFVVLRLFSIKTKSPL